MKSFSFECFIFAAAARALKADILLIFPTHKNIHILFWFSDHVIFSLLSFQSWARLPSHCVAIERKSPIENDVQIMSFVMKCIYIELLGWVSSCRDNRKKNVLVSDFRKQLFEHHPKTYMYTSERNRKKSYEQTHTWKRANREFFFYSSIWGENRKKVALFLVYMTAKRFSVRAYTLATS